LRPCSGRGSKADHHYKQAINTFYNNDDIVYNDDQAAVVQSWFLLPPTIVFGDHIGRARIFNALPRARAVQTLKSNKNRSTRQ